MGIHESQSLLWERMVGMSKPFWRFFWPKLVASFPENFQGTSEGKKKRKIGKDIYRNFVFLGDWLAAYKEMSDVNPDFIRVEADELTYPLHVIVRPHPLVTIHAFPRNFLLTFCSYALSLNERFSPTKFLLKIFLQFGTKK